MARLEDALRASSTGITLDLEVQPGAKAEGFPAGFNPWRCRIQARVAAPAQDGEANEALQGLVSAFFEVPRSRVRLTHGQAQRQKTVEVQGIAPQQALLRLREGLAARR